MKLPCALGLVLAVAVATPAAAVPFNVALGKPVTITGQVGVTTCCGWPDATVYPPASLSSIVDGNFVPAGTEWQDGTVWWDEHHPGSVNNVIEIALGGTFLVSGVAIQADNNDEYELFFRNFAGIWVNCCYATVFGGPGMQTRAGSVGPFEATAIRIDARVGDLFYSVSELHATGEAVPEPASLVLLGTGLSALVARRRRTRNVNR
jgi:PEP-CTERM motif